jgi:hypothetical protein
MEAGMRLASIGPRVLVAALLLAAPLRAGGVTVDWALSGCAQQQGNLLVLQNCDGACSSSTYYSAEGEATITAAGLLSLQLDWTSSVGAQSVLLGYHGSQLVYDIGGSGWCQTAPCSGSDLLQIPVLPGDTVKLALNDDWYVCSGITSVTVQAHLEPEVGFVPGFGGLDSRLISTAEGGDNEMLGVALCFLGDLDGDGLQDLAVGAFAEYVRYVSGATGATIRTLVKPSGAPYVDFGGSLAAVGDVNGDGVPDLLVGTAGNASGNGPASLFSGADGQLLLVIPAPAPNELFSDAVSAAGDVNLDGVPDLLIGSPAADGSGTDSGVVRVYSGATGTALLQVLGKTGGDLAGSSVASVGDVDGDGIPDVIVGSPFSDVLATNAGMVRIHSGWDALPLRELAGPPVAGIEFGKVVAAGGDLDADGEPDVLASAPDAGLTAPDAGHLRAFSAVTGNLLFALDGGGPDEFLGTCLASAGDWDGDGHGDVLAGTWLNPYAAVFSGDSHQILLKLQIDLPYLYFGFDTPGGSYFGNTCAGAGDANGDGRPDFAVGATSYDKQASLSLPEDVGKVFIYSGNSADYVPPQLAGTGALLPGTPLTLDLAGGDPFAPAFLIVGASALVAPFKSGLLVPEIDLLVPLALDGAGAIAILATWPPGIPSGTPIWMQAWLPDADGFAGWFASDSMTITPP